MVDNSTGAKGNGDAGERIAFDYIKSQYFRVIHADGAIGGITPNGHIHFALYSERQAIPRRQVHEVLGDGHLGGLIESETVSRGSIVREMEIDVFLTIQVAKSLHEWLGGKIADHEKLRKEPQKEDTE